MTLLLILRRIAKHHPQSTPLGWGARFLPGKLSEYCSRARPDVVRVDVNGQSPGGNPNGRRVNLSPLLGDSRSHHLDATCNVELMDDDTWKLSSGLALAWRASEDEETPTHPSDLGLVSGGEPPDFDDIDSMRVGGHLFYKLDRGSREFEECSVDFRRKGSSSKRRADGSNGKTEKVQIKTDNKDNQRCVSASGAERLPPVVVINGREYYSLVGEVGSSAGVGNKRSRNPTFNQLTAPYHEPFCLDIFVSKASVRACVVHRVTSKVVAVAHSISKDLKFDLCSTRNAAACKAVGQVLAERALADDIHDVVYTPRKGDRLQGKLLLVLQSIMDNGVDVKIKIKQRPRRRAVHHSFNECINPELKE